MVTPLVPTWVVYVLLCVSGVAGAVADWGLNQWVDTRNWAWWIVVVLGVGADVTLFIGILSTYYFPFGVAVAMSLVTHCLAGLAFDHAFYGKTYGPVVWSGICLGLVAMVLMDLGQRDDDSRAKKANHSVSVETKS